VTGVATIEGTVE